jgi:hypothetical protein
MQLLPTVWAGGLSMGVSALAALLCVLYLASATSNRILHIGLGLATVLASLIVLSSGIDSIVVHHERAVLVFAGIAVAVTAIILVIVKAVSR